MDGTGGAGVAGISGTGGVGKSVEVFINLFGLRILTAKFHGLGRPQSQEDGTHERGTNDGECSNHRPCR